jgi:hypothetical protein
MLRLDHQTVIALESGQPLVIRIDPSVILERLAYRVHLRKTFHEPGIITCGMDGITGPAADGYGRDSLSREGGPPDTQTVELALNVPAKPH